MRYVGYALATLLFVASAWAEERPGILEISTFLYGDNTEFLANPYRDGETLLGGQLRIRAGIPIGSKSRLWLGVVTDSRWGSEHAFETKRPVIAFEVGGPRDTFVLGTLRSGQLAREAHEGLWPDESGPHGLAPPLQLDTYTLTRPYEAGMQWIRTHERWQHDFWISWQQLNTLEHRERFDTGANTRLLVYRNDSGEIALLAQAHIVHEGGQLFHTGVVGDSVAGGPGAQVRWNLCSGTLRAEMLYLVSKHNPDRSDQARLERMDGHGTFYRLTYEHSGWRAAYIRWNGTGFLKWEGDPNYGSLGDDYGVMYVERNRMYDELSLSKRFTLADNAALLANARLSWVDGTLDYSYRVAAAINVVHLLRGDE